MVVGAVNVKRVKYPPELEDFEGWTEKKKILIVLAHPDDPEFFLGATLARWGGLGHEIHYCLITSGQKGSQDIYQDPDELAIIRKEEQRCAAKLLHVKNVQFLDYMDGELIPDLEMRKRIVRIIRQIRPQILVTSDPLNIFPAENRINHPDHRAAGQVTLDAAFPAAGNPMFFPELIKEENLMPINLQELWFSIPQPEQANLIVDMSAYFDDKVNAILCHRSQIGPSVEKFTEMMKTRWVEVDEKWQRVYLERFRRIILT